MSEWRTEEWWNRFRSSFAVRFWKRVAIGTGDDCWLWLGQKKKTGLPYGVLKIRYKRFLAHRKSWELTNGLIPDGRCVLHSCDNPPCVRPSHLFLGTQAENIQDMVLKGRQRNRYTAVSGV